MNTWVLEANFFSCPQDVKEAAYKSMVHPVLECGNSVLDPHYDSLNDELEKVQKRAATLKDFKNAKN